MVDLEQLQAPLLNGDEDLKAKYRYLKQIRSQGFIRELILSFEKHSSKVFWDFSSGATVDDYFIGDPSGAGSSVGSLFEEVFKIVCDRFRIPCEKINKKDADFTIGGTRFEMKTTRTKKNGEIAFIGSGVKGQGHKKCGNYILISYKMDWNKIVTSKSKNKGLITELFYSINSGIITTEDWGECRGKSFKLNVPLCKFNRLQKQIQYGNLRAKNKYAGCTTSNFGKYK